MFQFLNPIWLLAIGAIIIPLAIHLWNIKKGKTLKIGSISLLGETSRQNSSSLRLQDLWLLLLRCLLLILLAMLLAGPLVIQEALPQKAKGWVLIDKEHLQETYSSFKPRIDSLIRAGFVTHYFNPGFEMFNLADTQKKEPFGQGDFSTNISYWSLARALDKHLPLNTSAYVFTSNRQHRFTGDRPQLRSQIIWNIYKSPDTVYNAISDAYVTQRDSLRLILGHSRPGGLIYTTENSSFNNIDAAYQLSKYQKTRIRFTADQILRNSVDTSFVAVDTSVLQIALFTDKHPADMAYLKAALETVQSYSQRKISIKAYRNASELPSGLNWLFWLSELPVKESMRNKSENTLSYQPGKTLQLINSWIIADDQSSYDLKNTALSKRKSISNRNTQQYPLWKDETGNPVLTRTVNSRLTEFKFYSRFDPEWNDLVWDPRFPETVLNLILPLSEKPNSLERNDRQTLSLSQIQPTSINDQGKPTEKARFIETKLDVYFWILLMVLFALERWLSARQMSTNANG